MVSKKIVNASKAIVQDYRFELFIIGIILLQAAALGLETVPQIAQRLAVWISIINWSVIAIFTIEATLKILSHSPNVQNYFKEGWNVFDFIIVVVSLIPFLQSFSTVARLARLLRVMRLISALPSLRIMADTLVRSIPGMFNILLLMGVLFYIYGIIGFHLFSQADPQHWETLPTSLLTLFQLITLESWVDLMNPTLAIHPWAWTYFLSFIVLGTFIVINLFVAIVVENLAEVKRDELLAEGKKQHKDDIYKEIESIRKSMQRLETKIEKL